MIDPGTTFGAGTHESTRLSLELLQRLEPGGALCDWGAGSGVLSIAAARLGWDPVDRAGARRRAPLPVIEANARANGVAVEVRSPFDLLRDELPWAPTVAGEPHPVLHRGHRRARWSARPSG